MIAGTAASVESGSRNSNRRVSRRALPGASRQRRIAASDAALECAARHRSDDVRIADATVRRAVELDLDVTLDALLQQFRGINRHGLAALHGGRAHIDGIDQREAHARR